MKGRHITLPTLQFAAAAFVIAAAQAEEADKDVDVTYCVDHARQVVDSTNCDGTRPLGKYFFARGAYEEDEPVGANLTVAPNYHIDSSDIEARLAHRLEESGLVTRSGFGKRDIAGGLFPRACDPPGGSRGSGGSGGNGGTRVKVGASTGSDDVQTQNYITDSKHEADKLGGKQCYASIARHRSALHEHHDFFLAS
ncbi:hypothetical protein CDD83_5790 [Cordyceps sp. RAO-2017]|nr:hypothetical protein CDD83_5790 [Cordyceps sp. RAO-2017]